ncbi:hypothetical protein BDN70DRAFT_952887 [Pholiota conissans]|uniref:Uncharacterized protein n=1 Tax=Pholiota conissans TaxID=109636 RepID=A0A9P5Z9P1_9AGAR|nr:hypothetical protein BDN70DRAFT_952887 [Pholiota conissans]
MFKKIKKAVSFNRAVRPKVELTEEDIINGLRCISDKMKELHPSRHENPVQIIVSGGAVAVLILRIRKATDDVDYFVIDPDNNSALYDAKYAAASDPRLQGYSRKWINADMVAHILNHAGCETLFDDSIRMNLLLFQSDFLRVYVADWRFQLVGKIKMAFERRTALLIELEEDPDVLAEALETEVNIIDAAYILNVLIDRTNNGQPLRLSAVITWYYYGALITDEEITHTNSFYQKIFNRPPGILRDIVIR